MASSTARVYSVPAPPGTAAQSRPAVFGCLSATGRRWPLNATPKHKVTVFGQSVGFDFEPTTIAVGEGPWVAFAETFYGIDTSVQTITTRNLRTGKTRHCAVGAANAPGKPASIARVVVGKDGTTVWTGRAGSGAPEPGSPQVGRCEPAANREGAILGNGPGVKLGSLSSHGRVASWIEDGEERTAPIHG